MIAALARRPVALLVALIAYLGAVFAVSHLSGATLAWIGVEIWDKAAHFAQYVPVGFLSMGYLILRRGAPRGRLAALALSLAVSCALAALDELHQSFVPGRTASVSDAIADLLGAGIGALLALRVFRAFSSSPSETTS